MQKLWSLHSVILTTHAKL